MQTSGVFPQLSAGMKKGRGKGKKKPTCEHMEDGQGYTSRQPRPIPAPKTLRERREQSHKKAYGDKG